jgi:uncharacterized protein YjbJ (UPF0337 family)
MMFVIRSNTMNNDILQGQWKQIRGKVQQKWGQLTDNDLDQINGQRTELEGTLQKKFGYTKERAAREVDDFIRGL